MIEQLIKSVNDIDSKNPVGNIEIIENSTGIVFSLNFNFSFDFDIKDDKDDGSMNKYELLFHYLNSYCNSQKEKLEKHFEEKKLSRCCYFMVKYFGSNREWAEKIIEEELDSFSAYLMFDFCNSDLEWSKKIIENKKDPLSAFELVNCLKNKMKYKTSFGNLDFKKQREWAEKIIEEKKDLDHAQLMTLWGKRWGSDFSWYEKLKRKKGKNGRKQC